MDPGQNGASGPEVIDVNESFAATNEREGSEIARQIVHALTESDVRVLLVTHLFELAQSLHDETLDTALRLQADRRDGGHRTFRIVPAHPFPTSYGTDLYEKIFARSRTTRPRCSPAQRYQ